MRDHWGLVNSGNNFAGTTLHFNPNDCILTGIMKLFFFWDFFLFCLIFSHKNSILLLYLHQFCSTRHHHWNTLISQHLSTSQHLRAMSGLQFGHVFKLTCFFFPPKIVPNFFSYFYPFPPFFTSTIPPTIPILSRCGFLAPKAVRKELFWQSYS